MKLPVVVEDQLTESTCLRVSPKWFCDFFLPISPQRIDLSKSKAMLRSLKEVLRNPRFTPDEAEKKLCILGSQLSPLCSLCLYNYKCGMIKKYVILGFLLYNNVSEGGGG